MTESVWKSVTGPMVGTVDDTGDRIRSTSDCTHFGGSGTYSGILCGNSWLVKNIGFSKQEITGEFSMGASVLARIGKSLGSNRTPEEYLAPAVEFKWAMGKTPSSNMTSLEI
jgi:hypothetical protein